MSDFTIIKTGGKQYRVASGQRIKIENVESKDGVVTFEEVLLRSVGGKLEIGAPLIAGGKVTAKVLREGRGEKKIIFKHHNKTRQRKKKGHRQEFVEVEIS